ncbi:hypothetical protein GNI_019630 [Gregarina niphandrodes]|uniref:Uncharacterized protein n=1 Tax=Gregarina niphandrodes TaxID=110365 RepID=A0A023BC30_GRENI|nr:hypothetical protein GNI_019630 [Gregarina niphandrodes]EZG81187.1 hypothetical protein GNI_019630 [Gregarina niphandrodes]|eukprot:XP_011134245.1 hypothetical protein GNI_019630 [Gregarina niphandrodes]
MTLSFRTWLPTSLAECSQLNDDVSVYPGYDLIRLERLYCAMICDYYLMNRGPIKLLLKMLNVPLGDVESIVQSCLCNGAFVVKLAEHLRWFNVKLTLEQFLAEQRPSDSKKFPLSKFLPLLNPTLVNSLTANGFKKLSLLSEINPKALVLSLIDLACKELARSNSFAHDFAKPVCAASGWNTENEDTAYETILPEQLRIGGIRLVDFFSRNSSRQVERLIDHQRSDGSGDLEEDNGDAHGHSVNPFELAAAVARQIVIMAAVSRKGYRSWQRKHGDIEGHEGLEAAMEIFSMSIRKKIESIWQGQLGNAVTSRRKRAGTSAEGPQTDNNLDTATTSGLDAGLDSPYPDILSLQDSGDPVQGMQDIADADSLREGISTEEMTTPEIAMELTYGLDFLSNSVDLSELREALDSNNTSRFSSGLRESHGARSAGSESVKRGNLGSKTPLQKRKRFQHPPSATASQMSSVDMLFDGLTSQLEHELLPTETAPATAAKPRRDGAAGNAALENNQPQNKRGLGPVAKETSKRPRFSSQGAGDRADNRADNRGLPKSDSAPRSSSAHLNADLTPRHQIRVFATIAGVGCIEFPDSA